MVSNLKKNLALSLILVMGGLIFYMLLGFLQPIILGLIFAFLLYPVYTWILKYFKSKTTSALIIILVVFLIILVPISTIAGLILNETNKVSFSEGDLTVVEKNIYSLTGMNISISESIIAFENKIRDEATSALPQMISFTSNFLLSTFIMFFVMFYLLVDKTRFYVGVLNYLPFSRLNSIHLVEESGKVTKAILIGQVLTAVVQGLLGMFAFFVAGIPGAFLWGIVMIILSIIPVVGAFLIWVPAGIFLLLQGQIGMGVFVLLWGGIVISQIDNILRPKLVNKFVDIHPLETFIGVFMGLTFFGLIGVVIGPLAISLFNTLVRVYKTEYL